ncbi:alpha/beta hydrolase [Chryseobacterium sp. PTM-20240506]|uniref:alpha/beta hydrolase n=1 Tax=unclassified Chryseobacterium TaxID=2593645 RepID=UPI002358AC75|nr:MULTISPECIES: alpha/beta hydrolase [unclassified Chryseobacterium]MDC8104840.1 alpha/beta hydrolase [Chryseobacterium sp. B21-037]MDQ1805171.1 alpha/beta hydrolase [Chryseobacterium sp. CKR4-1]
MAVYILSNRKIVRHKNETVDSFSNDEYSIPNFRIAKCDFTNYTEPTAQEKRKKNYTNRNILNYQLFSEPEKQGYQEVLDVLLSEKNIKKSKVTADNLGGTQRMFYELYKNMSSTKSRSDVLIFIHGYAYDFDDELEAIIDLKKLFIDSPESPVEHILFVSWPASSSIVPLTYFDDKASSINSGTSLMRLFYFYTQFLKDIFSNRDLAPCNQRIHLMAHSLGNRVLQSMLYSLKSENILRVIDQVLLLNADVTYKVFEDSEDSFNKLPLLANRVSIYLNRKDAVLGISQFTKNILTPRLGKNGPSDIEKFKDIVSIVDCTFIENNLKDGLKFELGNHWGYLSSSQVQNDIFQTLNGVDRNLITNRISNYENIFTIVSK